MMAENSKPQCLRCKDQSGEDLTILVPAEGLQTYSMSHVCKTDGCFDIYALQSRLPQGSITRIDEQDNDKPWSPGAETYLQDDHVFKPPRAQLSNEASLIRAESVALKPSSALVDSIILSNHQAHHIDLTSLDQKDTSNRQDLMGW
jgi:hypothetical protein